MLRFIYLSLGLLLSHSLYAQVEESIAINDELDIPVTRYQAFADEAPILLWLPSSRGTSPRQAITASALGDLDIETWIVDLHTAYFVDPGRSSVEEFKPTDLARFIDIAASKTTRKVYLVATDAVAIPALEAVAEYQRQAAQSRQPVKVGGVILFHPSLNYPTRQAGEAIRYMPAARHSTIPIYYIQPAISTRQWRSGEIQDILRTGGSQVFFQPLPGVVAGYHMRPDDHLSETDIQARERLPGDLKRAMKLLGGQGPVQAPNLAAETSQSTDHLPRFGLKKLQTRPAPTLALPDLNSENITVSYADNAVTLVSFWASWCTPCIKELPSLKRLHDDYRDKGLQVVAINVAEEIEDIRAVMDEFGMDQYLNLRDLEGEATRVWNVYGYPTNFLVTRSGQISQGSIGGVEWDEPEVRQAFDTLFSH